MKKTILTGLTAAALVFMSTTALNAQETTSSNGGKQYLPTAGSWGIGISANPILNYFGNFFGKMNDNSAPAWNSLTQSNTLIGKYFLQDNMAIRARFSLGFLGDKNTYEVMDRSIDQSSISFPELPKKVENTWKTSSYSFSIAGGLEWRKSFNRLNLLYGAEIGVGTMGSSNKYTYGNELNPTATIPVVPTADDEMNGGVNVNPAGMVYGANARVLSEKMSNTLLVGLRGFFGVEYFVAPKISLAGEFGWGFVYKHGGQSTTTYESIGVPSGSTDPVVKEIEEKGTSKDGGFGATPGLNNQLFGAAGTISVNFYF